MYIRLNVRLTLALVAIAGAVPLCGCRSEVDEMMAAADQLKHQEDWQRFDRKLRDVNERHPEVIDAWIFRHWNLSYNLINEAASIEERYAYVQEAVEVLLEGLKANPTSNRLYWQVGWMLGYKFGRARGSDAAFRGKFRADEYLHRQLDQFIDIDAARGFDGRPSNWLAARLMFLKSIELHKQHPDEPSAMSPIILHSEPAISRICYAEDLVEEGHCGDVAVSAWKEAEDEWLDLAKQSIKTSKDASVRLGDYVEGGEPTDTQKMLSSYRTIVNFDSNLARCRAEQREDVRRARRAMFDARMTALKQERRELSPDEPQPKVLYEQAIAHWATVFAALPHLAEDIEVGEDVYVFLQGYRSRFLQDAPWPQDFPARELVEHVEHLHRPRPTDPATTN